MMNYIYTLIPIALLGFAAVQGSKWNFNAATYMDKKYTNAVKGIPLRSIEKQRTIKKPSSQPQILFNSPKPPLPRICLIRKVYTSQVLLIKKKLVLEQSGSGDTER